MTYQEKRQQIKKRREFLIKSQVNLPKVPRIAKMIYPMTIELAYFSSLSKIIEPVLLDVKETLIPDLPRIYQEYSNTRKFDSYSTTIKEKFSGIRQRTDIVIDEDEITGIVKAHEYRTNIFQKGELDKACMAILGIPMLRGEPWAESQKEAFINKNLTLIRSVPQEYLNSLEVLIQTNIEQGTPQVKLKEFILSSIAISEKKIIVKNSGTFVKKSHPIKRIHKIATDQIGSYYNSLNKLRQKEAGITEYYWGTMRDHLVRVLHRAREMKIFKWSNPPSDGHPGDAPGCRCIGYPKLDSFF